MPIKKYMMHVDGQDRQVSESNIEKYGIESYAKSYPDATIRMRDAQNGDYDIPIRDYRRALDSGLRPFVTSYYKDEEEEIAERSTFKPDSVAYMPKKPVAAAEKPVAVADSVAAAPETPKPKAEVPVNVPENAVNAADSVVNVSENPTGSASDVPTSVADTTGVRKPEEPSVSTGYDYKPEVQEHIAKNIPGMFKSDGKSLMDKPLNVGAGVAEVTQDGEKFNARIASLKNYYQSAEYGKRQQKQMTDTVNQIWDSELKGVVDNLIEKGKEEGKAKRAEYDRVIYADGGMGLGRSAMGILGQREYAKATDSKKVIEGVQSYLAKKGGSGEAPEEGTSNPIMEQLMQKVYDYLVQQHTPKSTAEYILRSVFSGSIVGQLLSMTDGKSYEQRQIEAGGMQEYQPSAGAEIGAMAASVGIDLPIMALTGLGGEAVGNFLLRGATQRLMASGLSQAAARGIATRAAQQTGMKWGIRTASEAVNFGLLEGLGSVVGQAYMTGDVDLGKAALSTGKGAVTGAVMGVFGVSNDKFRKMMEGGLGETAGRTLGYASSLGGRTAILTGSSVMGQYLENPDFDINDVDWTKEIAHAGLMNIGFDILGAVKKYQAYKRTGIRMRDLDKLHLTKEDIEQLNRIGIEGKDAQELAESILQVKDAKELRRSAPEGEGMVGNDYAFFSQELGMSKEGSVLGELLSHPDVSLSTKAKVAYLMTGSMFRLAPNTHASEVQEEADGSFTVDTFNPSGQTNETHRFRTREEAEAYRVKVQDEVMPNQVSVLEGMMNDAGKMATATRLFDMVAKQFGATKEQVAEAYARGRNGETLEGREKQAYEAIDGMLRSVQSVEDYHYSPSQLKRRMEESYGREAGWMDKVLKKKYNSLDETERRAYDEYLAEMKTILQGNQSESASIGAGESASGRERADTPLLPGGGSDVEAERATGASAPETGATGAPETGAALSPRASATETGAALYAEHDPAKMRQAMVRERVAYTRFYQAALGTLTSEDIRSLAESDDAGREAVLSTLDANQRRLAEDYLAQVDLVDGMNDAMNTAHTPEVEAAEALAQKMTSPNGKVVVVALGKHSDEEHEYGVVVSGVDASGNPTSPEGQIIVVPVKSQNWTPDYSTFDESRALSMRIEDAKGDVSVLEPDTVTEGMLGNYNADIGLLDMPAIEAGMNVMIADEEGNTANVQVVSPSLSGGWLVLEEGQREPIEMSEDELNQMRSNAENLPILAEYAEADKAYEREQRELQRQAERAEQKAREAEEASRIAEEMKKPVNRLAKHPDGKPDYENSRPEDVREYLLESLGLDAAVKSIRSQRADLERQVAEQAAKIETLISESEENDYFPDEAIRVRGLIRQEQDKLSSMQKKLDFWKGVERMTAGPTEAEAQKTVTRSVAQQKAAKTKRETYKPSDEYRKMQQAMAESEVALDVLNDLEPHTPEELAAQLISGGVRLMKGDETVGDTVLKGVQSMTGYRGKDLQRMNFIFATRANGGVSVGEFGEMLESAAQEAGVRFGGTVQEEGVNALLSLLGDVETMGDINRYVERNRMREASKLFEEEEAAIHDAMDKAAWEEYHMSYAEYQKLKQAITDFLEIRQRFTQEFWESDEYTDFISNFAENITDNGQEGNDISGSGSGIDEANKDDGGGNEVSSGGNQEPTGGLQTAAVVGAERKQVAEVEGSGTENRQSDDVGDGSSLPDRQGNRGDEGGTEVVPYSIEPTQYTTKKGKVLDMYLVKFDPERFKNFLSWDVVKKEASELRGWKDRNMGGYLMRSREDAERLAEFAVMRAETDAADIEALRKEIAEKQENELKRTYDEQGRETIESQARHSRSETERLASETESGSLEDAAATGRGRGTGGNRPAESGSGSRRPQAVNGYRIGETVLYKGKEATISDFENDGTPVLDTGMSPMIYEVGYWENIQKMPTTTEQVNRIAEAHKPKKKLERAEQRQKRNQPKREKQKEQMSDLFAQADAQEEKLVRQEQEIDAQLALLGEYKAGPKAQVREDMHTGAAKTLEKAGRKFAKSLASKLGGHVDGKELSRGITNIAPIGGDMVFRVWMDDAETQGVMMLINFEAAPDTDAFDKLVPKYGFWRMVSDKDISGVRNSNHNFSIDNVKELESGAFMTKVADDMLSEITGNARKAGQARTDEPNNEPNDETNNVVLTEKETKNDERRNGQADSGTSGTNERAVPDGRTTGNQSENPELGTEARQEAERTERGRDGGSVHGNNVPDTAGSGRVSERDGEQFTSIGTGPFGKIYNQFKGKIKEAFNFLIKNKSGDLLGVFNRKEIGDIDLVWGDEKKGFKHIIEEHVNVVNPDFSSIEDAAEKIEDIMTNGVVSKDGIAKATIEKDGYRVIVSKNFEGERKNWVLTAYDSTNGKGKTKEKTTPSITPITPNTVEGSRAVASKDVSSSESKDSKIQKTIQRNTNNFSFGETHLELPSGEIGKLKGNIEAIRTLKELEASGQPATAAQKQALLKFVGWGGLAEALNTAEYDLWQANLENARRWTWNESMAATAWSKKWGKHYEELRPLMTDEEWAQAQASTLNSHYTPEAVIRSLWEALEYMGFEGGKVLEPAMGVGHIVGFMPKSISERSIISGFELDGLPGRIAKQLYPDANITVGGYETAFRPSSKDAVVTNVPFGQTAPVDPALDKTLRRKIGIAYNLHNYFIIKGLLELKPGGVGAFVTSSATMDGRSGKAREYIAGMGVDLIGAIRLPNNAFKSNAGTEVTADILFFRKRLPGEQSNGVGFGSLKQVGTGTYKGKDKKGKETLLEVPLLVNEYFADRPEMMLGTVMTAHDAGTGGLYGGDSQTLAPKPGAELSAELADAIGRLPENALSAGTSEQVQAASGKESTTLKDGTLTVKDGKVYVANKEELTEVAKGSFKHGGKTRSYADATKDYLELKETLKELIKAEQTQQEDPVELRQKLDGMYDRFVEKYGHLNNNKALDGVLEEDVEHFLPQALEKVTTTVNPVTGRRTKTVSKGDGILVKRVSQPMTEPSTAESLNDAIGISQAYRGRMDVDYIASMLGMTSDEARERILSEREAYEDPVTGDLIDRDAYLSGNIREKLETARAAAENDSRYEQNVSDLESAMPESIPFVDISYKMGTPWIPADVYESFGEEVVGIKNMRISYVPAIDEFVVNGGYIDDYQKSGDFTTTRRDAMALFEDAINLRKPTITKKVNIGGEERLVKDEAATQEAISAIMDMNDAFIRYVQEKSDIHTRLQNVYNDRYNNYRLREYREPNFRGADGKVHYPGSNGSITLRGHQVKAVQRSLQGSTLLAHQVGTGKTFTMITTAMEMRRLGIARKPMIVVQNATLQDFAADFIKLYPGANILVPNEKERSASQRKRLFNLIATGDFDAIIIPQSFLAFIPDNEWRKRALIQARVDEIMAAAEAMEEVDRNLANRLKKEAENMQFSMIGGEEGKGKKKSVKKEAKKEESALVRETRKLDRRTDDVMTFEQMGVDALFIDEAHNFKKIGFATKMQNVKGVDTGFSERANSLYLKASYVQEKNGGRNVILATGTPITNTMAEVWTMMRFVAPEILEDYQIRTFDEFAATFGQVEPSLEQNSTGGFKVADRFKSYVNVPELIKAFRSHADVVLTSDVAEFKESKNIPKLKDDKMTNHVIKKSRKLEEVMDVLISALAEDEKKTGKDKTPGLPLVVFSKAKQAAIDLRLINPEYPDDPDSKTNKVVSEVMRIYKESTPDKGIQMIFCDSYQSPSGKPAIDLFDYDPDVPQFNLYRDIKQKLVDAGIPKEEIVIVSEISNADRKKAVFEKARNGDVRVLIGGTEKMGVGVNVQDRMIALHHMDAPIRPMDFEQRNGRILRQGNMFAEMEKPVEVLTYGVEGTLDATAYERLRIKQDFINQMMKGDVSGRVMEESDDEDPSGKTFSQMAAELSGDKTLQLLFVAENKLKKLEGLRRSHELKRKNAETEKAFIKTSLAAQKKKLKEAESVGEKVAKLFPEGITKLTINGRPVTEKLSKTLSEMLEDYEGRYALNRSVVFPRVELNDKAGLLVFGHDSGQLVYTLYVDKAMLAEAKPVNSYAGVWLSVNSALGNTGKRAAEIKQDIANLEAKLKGAESMSVKDFDKMDELTEVRKEVRKLKEELAKKAENPVPTEESVKLAKKNLKSGEKPVSLPEEAAGDSEESLDRMETAMRPFEEVAVNAPDMVVATGASDILKAMPGIGTLQFASIVKEASRKEVQAMYVPWTRQIIMLPKHGTVKEMRDKRWHESFHFGIDMIIPKGDEGRLMLERAASEADKLAPGLTKWVEDTYGNRNVSEEKVVHVLEDVVSYMEDAGRVKSLLGGLDFGSRFPVLNDVANRIINYLTNNGYGKESDDYRGYDEGNQPQGGRENQVGENDEEFATVRGSESEGREEIKSFLKTGTPVSKLTGKEFVKKEGQTFVEQVTSFFEEQGGKADSAFGEVLLDQKGVKNSKNHGMSRIKAAAFAAVKDVLENGAVALPMGYYGTGNKKQLTGVIVAPIEIDKERYYCAVEVIRNTENNRLYVHEAFAEEKFPDSVAASQVHAGESGSLQNQGEIAKLLQNILTDKIYYDYSLTEIEKGKLLESIDPIKRGFANEELLSDIKDKRLISILQTNPQENEEFKFSLREKAAPKKTGIGYKVFVVKDGKLYPPMVANPGGKDTPVGVWLDADAAPVAGESKTGRLKVKAGGKGTQGGSGTLAYRPGWHLGEIPYALQFNRKNPETGERELFPSNFVWAEVEYANDRDYQDEAMSYGMNASGKFQHSLAGLPRVPEDGAYRYRTNPNPETDPWVISGAMKVNRILTPSEVDAMVVAAGRDPQQRQAGALTDADIDALNRDLLSEIKFGLRGKPRRKAGESLISYNRRLKEWQQEVEEAKKRRDVENMDVENPLDTELNDLVMEVMNHPSPIRKRGESDEDFNARQAEWSEWYNKRRPEVERRIAEIKVELRDEKHAARVKEMERVDEHLYEGTIPDQKDDEGQLSDEEMREVREIFQEKMQDAKIAIDRDQMKRDIKQEIIERRRYIETSNLEDTFFVERLKKVAKSKEVLKAIPDYIERTYTGEETPELKEAAKMVSDWFEEVYNLMAKEGVLYDAPKIQDYVTHIWDKKRSPKEALERYENWVNTMRLRSPYTKHRVIPSYREGIAMGLVPKYEDITGIIQEYGHYATETIANKRMVDFLRNFKVFVPGSEDNMPMYVDLIVDDKVKDPIYQRMNHTALDGYKVVSEYHKYLKPVFGDQRILDHKQIKKWVNKLLEGIWVTSSTMKKVALSFSFFHHFALLETGISMMRPWRAAKVIGKNMIWDVIMKGDIPAMHDEEATRDAVKHLVSLGATNDYAASDVSNFTAKARKWAKDKDIVGLKNVTKWVDCLNRGFDKVLWDTIHDGFKIASFTKMAKEVRARAEREGWSNEDLEKALDECGHLVNDTFGGLHFDILGFSPKEVRIMRALLLSPDWTLATIRQALSPFGFGKLYGDEGFWKTMFGGENPVKMRKKYGRAFWVTAALFFYAMFNALNTWMRIQDEDEWKKIAEEKRKIDPSYKSPYELAYPDGMKWYDYTMLGNALGHQTHLFTGRYEDGTERYLRWGKQFRELPELFFNRDGFSIPYPMIEKIAGKANPLLNTFFTVISGHSLSGWENEHMKGTKDWDRTWGALLVIRDAFIPYSIPTQEDKDWYVLDLIMPSSKGFSQGKAINYFEKGIKSADMEYIRDVYNACVMNGLNPEKSFDVAKARFEAEGRANMLSGVDNVQDALLLFGNTTDVQKRKRLVRYIEQQIGAQDFNAISQEEMLLKAKDVISGEDAGVEASDIYLGLAEEADIMEDIRLKKNAAGLRKYYQDYSELVTSQPEAGQRMLEEKRMYIEGYVLTTKTRTAINRIKKAMKDGRVGGDEGMNEIRRLRSEYFKRMNEME